MSSIVVSESLWFVMFEKFLDAAAAAGMGG
jgi:hypothetical protein